ncbi:hypothetical protein [Streptomyces pseudovenezuelae]|uniref:Transposase DDE domain-containing protein n=1 Tax=Streptomyces pseudovenezuelae TaxID=67350 RepID=A0ABZ1X9C8_9ACTN|nr:hypothetical protein [Streptomyces pseudovenezuelae]
MLDDALAQLPGIHRHGTPILIRTDSAGSAKAFLRHLRYLRYLRICGMDIGLSVGIAVAAAVRRAIRSLPERIWHPALDQD